MHTHTHLHYTHAHMHTCIHALHTCTTHMHTHNCTHAHMHMCTHAHAHTKLYTCAHNCTHAHTLTCTNTHLFSFSPPLWPREAPHDVKPHLLMTLDHSAQYLIAADARRMVSRQDPFNNILTCISSFLLLSSPPPSSQVLYILQFYQEGSLGDASVTSITEYLLTQPILSFVFSGHTPFLPPGGESGDDGEGEDEAGVQREFDSRRNIVLIKLHCIQSRFVFLYLSCLSVCLSVCPSPSACMFVHLIGLGNTES